MAEEIKPQPQPTKEELIETGYEEFKNSPAFNLYVDIDEARVKEMFTEGFRSGYDSNFFGHHQAELSRRISNAIWVYADSYETPGMFEEKVTISQISGFIHEMLNVFSMKISDFGMDAMKLRASNIDKDKMIEEQKKQLSAPATVLEEIQVRMLSDERTVEEVGGSGRKFEIDMYKTFDYRLKNKLVVDLSAYSTHKAQILDNGKAVIIG